MADYTIGDYDAAITIDGSTNYLLIQPGGSSTAYKKINRNILLGVTGQPADISTAQSLTNKTLDNTNTITLKDTLFTLQDDGDTTKQAKFQLSGITTATTRTYTLPNASSTLVDLSTSQTLTNKTLTSPVITGGSIANPTLTVDSIAGYSSASTVSVAGLGITSGVITTNNSVVTANIADLNVTNAKLQMQAWITYTPTFAGFSVNPTVVARYIQFGKTCIMSIWPSANGTSNATSFTITAPFTAANTGTIYTAYTSFVNNGSVSSTPGYAQLPSNTNVITLYQAPTLTTWTAANAKSATFTLIFETA